MPVLAQRWVWYAYKRVEVFNNNPFLRSEGDSILIKIGCMLARLLEPILIVHAQEGASRVPGNYVQALVSSKQHSFS